jgi:hypothetical protein
MKARIVPGFISPAGGKALLIVSGAARLPQVQVRAASAHQPVPAAFALLRSGTAFDQELARRGVWTFQITLGPNIGGATVGIEATVDGQRAFNAVPVVPAALPPEGLTLAAATCFYNYYPTSGATSYRHHLVFGRWFGRPKLKLLAGDNLYLDVAPGQMFRRGAYNETAEYYAHYFTDDAYAELLAGECTITTWDDHEFWNNYPEEQAWLGRSRGADRAPYTDAANAGLELFQTALNPDGVVPAGRSYSFKIDPVSFFVADTRTRRTLHARADRRLMPDGELAELVRWAQTLQGPGVLVLGQPLWAAAGSDTDWNPPAFERQYATIWGALTDAPYDVMVLSGDVHFSRVIEIAVGRGRVYEVVTSPAVHIPSVVHSGLASLGLRLGGPSRGTFELPGRVPVDPRYGVSPRLSRLLFGHDESQTFALIQLQGTADRVDVGLALVDHAHGNVPASPHSDSVSKQCFSNRAFSLAKRQR